ncbi:MAG: hypothetical protein JXR34_13700 [Bacteroidales bacterium]|nr:hypothetical protein [Bacteroidales bacterium]
MKKIRFLEVTFENPIEAWELVYFRGAVIAISGRDSILFHNHDGEGFRYSYPLIQYKRIDKKPRLVCIEEGIDEVHRFFENRQEGILLNKRPYELNVEGINLNRYTLQVWDTEFLYYLQEWMPISEKNKERFENLHTDEEFKEFFRPILIGNILSMAKGIGWTVDKKINVEVANIKGVRQVNHKGLKMHIATLTFKTNVLLPDNIGLGKNAALGYGTIRSLRNDKNAKRTDY